MRAKHTVYIYISSRGKRLSFKMTRLQNKSLYFIQILCCGEEILLWKFVKLQNKQWFTQNKREVVTSLSAWLWSVIWTGQWGGQLWKDYAWGFWRCLFLVSPLKARLPVTNGFQRQKEWATVTLGQRWQWKPLKCNTMQKGWRTSCISASHKLQSSGLKLNKTGPKLSHRNRIWNLVAI